MPTTTHDILTDEDAVYAQIEATVEQNNVFRNAFRPADLSGANSEVVNFVVHEDDESDIEIVPEGGEYPRDMSERRRVPCYRDKYGEEYAITMEALNDGIFDDVAEEANAKMRRMAERMDAAAAEVLQAATTDNDHSAIGDDNGTLTYADIVDANTTLLDDPFQFSPDQLYVGPQGMGDLLKDEVLTHASEDGDERISSGMVGTIVGIGDVYMSNSGVLGAGEAILVDSSKLGREGVWLDMDTREYQEPSKDVERVMQMKTLRGWAALRSNAAIPING
ncbi:phage major capsid protein [Halomarina oriensis]|uniref:Phage major capsid protein n=1 Tax=Halomarina oriensis TaxID=671145 RepID=A0A6B0GNG9_9EURY|nr:hypothetical protein [Halomarina oriensis]MWG36476.1 hypothetical protein [Halomarina oriensis]